MDQIIDQPLETRLHELTALVESVATANATAAELMAELEETREILEQRNLELEEQKAALQQALAQARSADASNQAKSRFLATISHEMRTPLNAMLGLSSLLLDSPMSPEQALFTRQLHSSSQILLTLINDLLDIAKIEAGQLLLEPVACAPAAIVESVVTLLAPVAHAKGLELLMLPSTLPATATADPTRLRQILLNLVNNAIRFTDRGEVTVSATISRWENTTAILHVQVRDSGIGIPTHAYPNLFTPFTQLENSATRNASGAGLGLAISRQLVEKMGGEIGFRSRLSQGSTFWFTIPLQDATPPAESASRTLGPCSILIVDDNDHAREALASTITPWQVTPLIASSTAAALQLLQSTALLDPTYILLDEHIPGSPSFAATINVQFPHCRLILLRATGLPPSPYARNATVPISILPKPIFADGLWQALCPAPATAEPAASSSSACYPSRSGLVLLVEDNLVNRMVISTLLRKTGLTVHEAGNGIEALEAAARTHYDLIFMDCQMPTMDGYEATREIRFLEDSHSHTPILALTAHAMGGDRDKCLAAGMDDYLSKPITEETLQCALSQWLPAPVS